MLDWTKVVCFAVVALFFVPRAADADSEDYSPSEKAAVPVQSAEGIVAADNPVASEIGARVLRRGGNAADAGVATLLALGVVHPFSSGLGGGGFCLFRGADTGEVSVIDYREEAPSRATHDMFVKDGEVEEKLQLEGGLASGVPGEPAGLWALQHGFGKIPWTETVRPAHRLAKEGFEVPELLESRLEQNSEVIGRHPSLARAFKRDGQWVRGGEQMARPKLAKALKILKQKGVYPFYHGAIADAIVRAVNRAGGIFRKKDLERYHVAHRRAVSGTYRGYKIHSMPPPSSGGTTLVETLNILEGYKLDDSFATPRNLHLIAESLKHAFADRARWLGDEDFVDVPVDMLISKSYAARLRQQIEPESVLPTDAYGTKRPGSDEPGTTHVSVLDAEQNMLACTSTINTSFGSKVFVDEYGIVMNNEMGDFTAQPGVPNNYGLVGTKQNAVAPGKRPLSSMSPTLVVRNDKPHMVVGASGGPTIITGTLMSILREVDFKATPSDNMTGARIHHQWLPDTLFMETGFGVTDELEQFGHEPEVKEGYSNVQMIVKGAEDTYIGVSDPRKGGEAAAE